MATLSNGQWRLNGFSGFEPMILQDGCVPHAADLGVLVHWKCASVNCRDLVILNIGSPVHFFVPGHEVAGIHVQSWQHGFINRNWVPPESGQHDTIPATAASTAWDCLFGLPSKSRGSRMARTSITISKIVGPGILHQSLDSIKDQGVSSLVEFVVLDEENDEPRLLEALHTGFQEVISFIDTHSINPKIDEKAFDFAHVRKAYRYMGIRSILVESQ
ncbi:hypothetical protein V8C42DRAFT_355760 [Trichoderma barbatum]